MFDFLLNMQELFELWTGLELPFNLGLGIVSCLGSVPEVFPLQMEGVRLVVNKGLSNHFQVSHTVTLSTLGESGYRFGSTYVGSKQTGPAEVSVSSHCPKLMLISLILCQMQSVVICCMHKLFFFPCK